jgi:hypothetical protein
MVFENENDYENDSYERAGILPAMMGPIHLFEPGQDGHRPVIARYIVKSLQKSGIPFFLDETPLDPKLNSLAQLDSRAQEKGCPLTHVLTLEDHFHRLLKDGFGYRKIVPSVGNYYLYTNLKTFLKGAGIRFAMKRARIERLLVSDEMRQDYRWGLGDRADFVVDPWDPDEFPPLDQKEARRMLGLGDARTIFLLFGTLTARKGARLVLDALQRAGFPDRVLVILAGQPDAETRAWVTEIMPRAGASLRCDFDFIPETLVSAYFHAADYVLSAYPAWFRVSSGTFTRACAAGRPSIVGHLGALADRVKKNHCGLIYKNGCAAALAEGFSQSSLLVKNSQYETWAKNAALLGHLSCLNNYGSQLIESYKRALGL